MKFLIKLIETRKEQWSKIIESSHGKIPVVIEWGSTYIITPLLKQNKFLFPEEFTFFDFSQVIRRKLQLNDRQTVSFFFSSNKFFRTGKSMKQIYEEWKDWDGFLYCQYVFENKKY